MSRSAVLRLPLDVRQNICRQLIHRDKDDWSANWSAIQKGCGTLATLARTCRLFSEPSLDVLWHSIPDLFVLFYALPSTCYQKQVVDNHGRTQYTFRESVRRSDLARLLTYARRVRAIKEQIWHIPRKARLHRAAPSTYDTFADLLQSQPLFPNIQTVEHSTLDSSYSHRILRSIHILFAPQLRTLRIMGRAPGRFLPRPHESKLPGKVDAEEDIAHMLRKIKDLAPGLRDLDLDLDPSSPIIAAAVSHTVCGLNNLTSVQLSSDCLPLTPQALAHLSRLPRLHTLRFSSDRMFWRDSDLNPMLYASCRHTFPVLSTFHITSPTFCLPVQLLAFIYSPRLADVQFDATDTVPRKELRPLFSALAAHPSRNTVESLSVNANSVSRGDGRTDIAPAPICAKTLAPLLGLPRLRELTLDIRCPFDVDDFFLRRISLAWPLISQLTLGTQYPWGSQEKDAPVVDEPSAGNTSATRAAIAAGPGVAEGDYAEEDHDEEEDLCAMPRGWRRPRATLLGIAELVSSCPILNTLGVEFDASISSVPPESRDPIVMLGGQRGHKLSHLAPGLSPIDDPCAVAAFLSNAFGDVLDVDVESLERLEPMEDNGEEPPEQEWWCDARKYRGRWEAFRDLLPKFALIREQERRWKMRTTMEACSATWGRFAGMGPPGGWDGSSVTDISEDPEDLE